MNTPSQPPNLIVGTAGHVDHGKTALIERLTGINADRLQEERDRGQRKDGLTTAEREELARLRRENRQLRVERDILAKATAWFAGRSDATSTKSSDS